MRSNISIREREREAAYSAALAERRPIEPIQETGDRQLLRTVRGHKNNKLCCALCFRTARGFFFKASGRDYAGCSKQCIEGIMLIQEYVMNTHRSTMLTDMEKKAISDTRMQLFPMLQRIGISTQFTNCSKEQVDWLIHQIWDCIRESMQKQSDDGDIPF